jgi:CPA2 family monovalent cation:H+ antiporter-2
MADLLLFETLVIVLASFALVALLVRLRFSPIVGYLAAGLIIGPYGLNLLPPSEGIRFLGELGVVLLMFIVGLEFSLPRMMATRRVVFGMGSLQVGITTVLFALGARFLGVDWAGSLLIGGALAMSSTAIALKQLSEQGELSNHHGRLALGILLFQDLASLPILVLIGAFNGRSGQTNALAVTVQILIAVACFLVIAVLARRSLARLIEWVARSRSAELFLLAVLAAILSATFVAGAIGLSLPIGAFLVGMIIGESHFRHQVEVEIRPFRDVLLGLFFFTVGMAIDVGAVVAAPVVTLACVLLLVSGKALVVYVAARAMGWGTMPALRAGIVLANAGEFALLITTQAMTAGLVDRTAGQLVLASTALSMALAPVLLQWNGRLAQLVGHQVAEHPPPWDEAAIEKIGESLNGHVILCGCGRIGSLVAKALAASGVPAIAIESDVERFRAADQQALRVIFGDGTRYSILKAAGVERAGIVVVTFSDRKDVERLLHQVRHFLPSLPVIVSTADNTMLLSLVEAGATRILPENLAAGLALVAQTLLTLGFSPEAVERKIIKILLYLNPELRGLPPPSAVSLKK